MKRLLAALLLLAACGTPTVEKAALDELATLPVPSSVPSPQVADPGAFAAPTTTERPKPRVSRSAPRTTVRPTGDIWWQLALCESGGDPRAVSSSGTYRGAFQFSLRTWRSVGMAGDPIQFDYETQLIAAKRLQARSGWGQWPSCSRQLGLR